MGSNVTSMGSQGSMQNNSSSSIASKGFSMLSYAKDSVVGAASQVGQATGLYQEKRGFGGSGLSQFGGSSGPTSYAPPGTVTSISSD